MTSYRRNLYYERSEKLSSYTGLD